MARKHVAVIVESSYGHFVSVLGVIIGLLAHGYRVTCAVSEQFAAGTRAIGAEPVVYTPPINKMRVFSELRQADGSYAEVSDGDPRTQRWNELRDAEDRENHLQIGTLYQDSRPDLVIYDRVTAQWAKRLAKDWDADVVQHSPISILLDGFEAYDDRLVIVSVPRFFQADATELEPRFQFVGVNQSAKKQFFEPWHSAAGEGKVILVSATTGLPPQVDFFQKVIQVLSRSLRRVVLSVGKHLNPAMLPDLPGHFEVNQTASNLEILEHACLFIGQGGQGSVLEAMHCGVPSLIVPPRTHDRRDPFGRVARRVAELGAGRVLDPNASPADIECAIQAISQDPGMTGRLDAIRALMRGEARNGVDLVASLIDAHVNRAAF